MELDTKENSLSPNKKCIATKENSLSPKREKKKKKKSIAWGN